MGVTAFAVSAPFPAGVAMPRSREHSPAFSPVRVRTPPPRPAPGLSSRRSAPGSRGGTAALHSAARPSPVEPRNRVVLPPQLDEIAPDVVVGIPERGIHRDRALAFGDRLVIASLERVHPAEKRVRLRRWQLRERSLIQVHRARQIARQLALVRALE